MVTYPCVISKELCFFNSLNSNFILGELSFGGRWAPKLTNGPYNSSN